MLLQSLGYVGVETTRLDEWRAFGPRIMGLEVADATASSLAFRMDDRKQRILVDQGSADGAVFYGWRSPTATRWNGSPPGWTGPASGWRPCRGRRPTGVVGRGLCFLDPSGNRHEAFCDPALADRAFRPGRAMSGFRTGPLGMGHVVLMAQRIEDLLPFYVDASEFRLSDYMLHPFKAYFSIPTRGTIACPGRNRHRPQAASPDGNLQPGRCRPGLTWPMTTASASAWDAIATTR